LVLTYPASGSVTAPAMGLLVVMVESGKAGDEAAAIGALDAVGAAGCADPGVGAGVGVVGSDAGDAGAFVDS